MAIVDKSAAPYYDDFDPSKQYTQILSVPGRYEQAREFTQAQTMIYHFLKRISDTLFKEGNIIEGMGYRMDTHTVTVEDGKVYLGGKILDFKEQTIGITGEGVERIGVKLEESIVTENEDQTLKGIAPGFESFGQPGAHRLKAEPVLTYNDPDARTIYEFEDGILKLEPARPELDSLMETLARRTFDESGNYRVYGYDLFAEPYDANNIQLTIDAGLAYVMGYQVLKPAPVKKLVPISKDTRTALNEPKVYKTDTVQYALNNFPAKQINNVVAVVEKTVNMTRGAVVGGIDYLPDTAIVSIESVADINGEYEQGTDFQLTNDGIDWGLGGLEPNPGASYTVTYRYNKTMINGTDYELYQETGDWGDTKDYIKFLSGDKPVENSTFTVDYEFYLARVDLVTLDKDGNINIIEGQPNIARLVYPPVISDETVLQLGTVYLPPAAGNAEAFGGAITRMSMEDLQKMYKRLVEVEYNQAISALDREAAEGEPATDLKGIFSDSFRSITKGDLAHPDFSVMYSLEDGVIMLPPNNLVDAVPVPNLATSDIHSWGRIIAAPLTEKVIAEQPYATKEMLINPYLISNTMGTLRMNPETDNWVDEDKIVIEKTQTQTRNFYQWWIWSFEKKRVEDLLNEQLDSGQNVSSWRPKVGDKATITKTEKTAEIFEEAITYMRQIEVEFTAENLVPNGDNFELFFDGVRCDVTPLPGFSAGTKPGSIRANSKGEAKGKFTIPANIRTGTREVVLKNLNSQALGTFTSIGTKRTVKETILKTKITLTVVDPLAQTFQFDQDQILTSVGLYFSAVDPTKNVVVQIRNVVNGYPSNIVYGEKVLTPDRIKASANATQETKVTFDDPIYCQANTQYCVVLLSDSPVPAVWVCELGETDVTTGNRVTRQPYIAGMLFSSKNGITWTAHQTMNLKFKLYAAEFKPEGVVEFEPITGLGVDRILILVDYLTPRNTGCVWEMRINDGSYQPIRAYEDVDLGQQIDKVQLRARFKSDKNMSPLIALDGFTFIGFLSAQSGSYISRNVEGFDRNIELVKQVFDAHIPQGCTITPQFSYDGGETWITPTLVSTTPVSIDYNQYTFEATVPEEANARQFRARINISANAAILRPKVRKFMNIIK